LRLGDNTPDIGGEGGGVLNSDILYIAHPRGNLVQYRYYTNLHTYRHTSTVQRT
jgi:hypothetical protein